ncbi:hypothetical protein ACE193_15240 [Bernardetia sp. OM2101]|uniref:hypothetical protein n=1 Tax=Bernardetia sp. OM2101 TaxID=3344876 RepID=UPI0035CF368E
MTNEYGNLMGLGAKPFPSDIMNSHEWFLHYMYNTNEIPQEIQARLKAQIDGSGVLKIREHVLYTKVQAGTGVTRIDLFKEDLQVRKGVRNIRNARPEKNQVMLVRGMRVRLGTQGGTVTDGGTPVALSTNVATAETQMAVLKYEGIDRDDDYNCFKSSEFSLKSGSNILVHELSACVFESGLKQVQEGFFMFDKPIILQPDQKLDSYFEFGDAAMNDLPVGTAISVELIGSRTY